ncbi:M42 family metallopeptidase [Nocardioides caldifontis]|uniref:M42 family metallopeptidase n=1 Tax=Nocardioides caldifontis TaxID=2588938 RepID=UPI0019394B9E|nr:M20/M25/M40 family metallo-hydrolase [Nocardioides caldifontis]
MPIEQSELLQELMSTYGPGGLEDEVRAICERELEGTVDELWTDPAGNLVGLVRGRGDAPVVRVTAHLDELSMIVKRVEPDGTLRVEQLGVMYPGNFGLGPVAVLGDHEELTGVLTLGSEHTTQESPRIWETKPDQGDKALDWTHVYVFTGRSAEELHDAGVHPGTRVCVHRSKRTLVQVGDFAAGFFMDARALVAASIAAAQDLREGGQRPPGDVYLVFSTGEEMGGIGASYAARTLPGDVTLALDVGPAEAEYQTEVDAAPIVVYADALAAYDSAIADHLYRIGVELGVPPTRAVFSSFESDASQAKASGQSAQAALLALPTLSTHGYEVVHTDAIGNLARLLAEYLRRPVP